ncbi:MAG: Hpt domain-containing protein [Bacteroidia bacterium]
MKNFTIQELEKITDGNTTALVELLEIFLKESDLQIRQLENFLTDGNIHPVKNTAHKIKSSLSLLGLDAFRPLAEKIERADESITPTFREDVVSLIKLCKETHEQLKIKLKEFS